MVIRGRTGPCESVVIVPFTDKTEVHVRGDGMTASITKIGGDQPGWPARMIAEKKTEPKAGTVRFFHEKAAYKSPDDSDN